MKKKVKVKFKNTGTEGFIYEDEAKIALDSGNLLELDGKKIGAENKKDKEEKVKKETKEKKAGVISTKSIK